MKKKEDYTKLFNSDFALKEDLETDKIKTTNVNILLNRVRKDKRNTLKKRILVSLLFAIFVISVILLLKI